MEAAALEGVPVTELREHRATRGCHRCGRSGHRATRCYAGTTKKGTTLPGTPWRVSAGRKRGREEEEDPTPAPKQQKVSAAEVMGVETIPLWDSESDF